MKNVKRYYNYRSSNILYIISSNKVHLIKKLKDCPNLKKITHEVKSLLLF